MLTKHASNDPRGDNPNPKEPEIIFDGVKKDKLIERMCAGYMHLKRPNMSLFYGFDGLMYFVCNPVTREQITLTSPVDPGMLCGFFFHPPTKEYREFFVRKKGTGFRYYMYSLGGSCVD